MRALFCGLWVNLLMFATIVPLPAAAAAMKVASPTKTRTATSTRTSTKTPTPTLTITRTLSPSPTATPITVATSTATPSATPALTATPTATSSNTAIPTSTPTRTATATPTPTLTAPGLPACPLAGATLLVTIDNPTATLQSVTVEGVLLTPACSGGAVSYSMTATCAVGTSDCFLLPQLASGVWKHEIRTGVQNQLTKSIVVADDVSGGANVVAWTVFKTVLTVDRTDDVSANPTPLCPSVAGNRTCTLRQAMAAGAAAAAPLLVQFDPTVFPAGQPTTIQLTQTSALRLFGYRMTVDATDANGDPTFRDDPHHRIVALPNSGSTFVFSNQRAQLLGIFLQRPLLSNGATPGDIVRFDGTLGPARENLVANSKIDGGGSALTLKSSAHDCVSAVGGAGLDWSAANVIRNSELTACPDKGAKATTLSYLAVEDSWVHHNIGGGLQATLSGNIAAQRNLIEYNGYNATAQVFLDANGIAANGANAGTPDAPSRLQTNGNIVRSNSSRGISVHELSTATITNDFVCGTINSSVNAQNGIAIFNSTASPASASVRGTASVYNGRNGATVAHQSTADFGQLLDDGNNAFAHNAVNPLLGGRNFDNSSTQVSLPARGNQWQRCYANPANPAALCDGAISLDTRGSVDFAAAQPQRRSLLPPALTIQSIVPSKARAGDLLHIFGSGFNAIDGLPPGGDCSTSIQQNNSCDPLVGTCVQYEAAPGLWLDLPVQAVTPTTIVVQLPETFVCAEPLVVRARYLDYTGTVVSAEALACTNF